MKTLPDASFAFWLADAPARDPAAARAASLLMPQSRHQLRANRTTSLVREMTDAATRERDGKVAQLRQARLAKEAAEKVEVPTSPKKGRKAKG